MAGGRRRHTLRSYERRIGKLLSEERERAKAPLPPISQAHRELRERIDAAYQALLGAEASENADPAGRVFENLELATDVLRIQDMVFAERKMLEAQGLDPRPFQR
jgi:hypothetical protein